SSKHPSGFVPPSTEELTELRERVQEFTRREIPESLAEKTDKDNAFPNEMWSKLGEAGFLGITAHEEYGGLAMGYQAHCIVMEEISRASGTHTPESTHTNLAKSMVSSLPTKAASVSPTPPTPNSASTNSP
ncbi:MAG: hypothetical protein Q9183_006909, partial [Haloplaca sp. 2 TL-2023]